MGRRLIGVVVAIVSLTLAAPAFAQVDERLKSYTGRNATGYLAPLVDAFRSNLNSGLFHTARIPVSGFHLGLEVNVMSTFFGDDSRTFLATTEGDFVPEQQAEAPTVIGDPEAVIVTGDASTQFAFPGGFDIHHFYFSCPQVTVGSWKGTEALGRVIIYDTGVSELGRMSIWGAGLRHSISQHFPGLAPFDFALGGYWQEATLQNASGHDVIDSRLATASLQSGVQWGPVYPYAGVSATWFDMDVNYRFDEPGLDPIALAFQSDGDFQLTMGVSYRVAFLAAYGEYNLAAQSSVAAGLAISFPFSDRSVTQ